MRRGVGRARCGIEINKFVKNRVQVAGTLEGKRVENTGRVNMMLGIVLQFQNMSNLSSFTMFATIAQTGGGSDKVSEVWVERVI